MMHNISLKTANVGGATLRRIVCACLIVLSTAAGWADAQSQATEEHFDDGQTLFAIADRADAMIADGQTPQAVKYLEEKVKAYSAWKQANAEASMASDMIVPILYYRLACAKNICGHPANEVLLLYKQVVNAPLAMLPFEQMASLVWLHDKMPMKDFAQIIRTTSGRSQTHDPIILLKVLDAIRAGSEVGNLKAYKQYFDGLAEGLEDPVPFFHAVEGYLVRNEELTSKTRKQVADGLLAYSRTQPRLAVFAMEADLAMAGILLGAGKAAEASKLYHDILRRRPLEGKRLPDKIRGCTVLNALAAGFVAQNACVEALELYKEVDKQCGADPNLADIRRNAVVGLGSVAEKYVEKKNFRQAVEVYRDVAGRYKEDQDKVPVEFRICQCLRDGEEYQGVVSEIDRFLMKGRSPRTELRRTYGPQMILMKGHCLIQLGEIDAASDLFLSMLTEYPEVAQAPDAAFFVGYCKMLQGKFDEAKEGFNVVLKEYPSCGYVGKTKEFLDRIQRMTE